MLSLGTAILIQNLDCNWKLGRRDYRSNRLARFLPNESRDVYDRPKYALYEADTEYIDVVCESNYE